MLVVGAGGMAKELLEILAIELNFSDVDLVFYDDVNVAIASLYDRYRIMHSLEEANEYLNQIDNRFVIGIGNPVLRKKMHQNFSALGGKVTSVISKSAVIGSFNTNLGEGSLIMQGVVITNDVTIGEGVIVNLNSTISHDCFIDSFTEIACNVSIPGRCKIGKNVFIGSNATLMPDVTIGDNAIIGAGTMVLNDVSKNSTIVGNPPRLI